MKTAVWIGSGALAAAALALAAACTPADIGDATDQSCQAYAYAYCQKLEGCSTIALEMRFSDAEICTAVQKAACVAEANAPSSTATAAFRDACTPALQGWACSDFLNTQNPPIACQEQAGPLQNGTACGIRTQCQSLYCALAAGQACGTCAPAPMLGASCAVFPCALGDSCEGTPPVCATLSLTGGPCGLGLSCVAGLNCVGSSNTSMGTCQPPVQTAGMPCEVAGAGCDLYAGLACNAASGTCHTVALAGPGEACGTVADQPESCAQGSCVRGACVARPTYGEACNLEGQSCISPAHCVVEDGGTSGTCQVEGATACQ